MGSCATGPAFSDIYVPRYRSHSQDSGVFLRTGIVICHYEPPVAGFNTFRGNTNRRRVWNHLAWALHMGPRPLERLRGLSRLSPRECKVLATSNGKIRERG